MVVRSIRLFIAAALAGICLDSFAWAALAYGDGQNTFVLYNSVSRAKAEDGALTGCRREGYANCAVMQQVSFNGGAVVVAKGDGGWGVASNENPAKAVDEALLRCRKVAKKCLVMDAYWDAGAYWGAVAVSDDGLWVRVNADGPDDAETQALAKCRRSSAKPETCHGAPSATSGARVYYVKAVGADKSGVAFSTSEDQAKQDALSACRSNSQKPDTCVFHDSALNDTEMPEPAAMQKVYELAKRGQAENARRPVHSAPGPVSAPSTLPQPRPRCINPATGLPMLDLSGGCGGFDIQGNPYGMRRMP